MDSEQCQGFQVEHNIGKAFMMWRYTFRVFRLFFSTCLLDNVRKLEMITQKTVSLFCLPEWSILIGHYEAKGLQYFNLAKSHVNNRFYFGVDPIHLYSISTGL